MEGPSVAVLAAPADAGWAATLALDLTVRGLPATGPVPVSGPQRRAVLNAARAIVLVHSRYAGPGLPSDDEIADVRARGGHVVLVRRNQAKVPMDAYPGRQQVVTLWDGYYQPESLKGRRAVSGGFAHLLDLLAGPGATHDLRPGFVFVSYRGETDRAFVQHTLRPALAMEGYPSWDYRQSEHLDDEGVAQKLCQRISDAGCVLVVGTSTWFSPWTVREVGWAHQAGTPVLGVRPTGARASRRRMFHHIPMVAVRPGGGLPAATTAALASTPAARQRW